MEIRASLLTGPPKSLLKNFNKLRERFELAVGRSACVINLVLVVCLICQKDIKLDNDGRYHVFRLHLARHEEKFTC